MEFNKKQKKIINSKPNGHMLIKGESGTGKTTAYINKIPALLNNYCINKNDRILVSTNNNERSKHVSFVYDHMDSEKYHQNSFFDVDNTNKLEISTISSLIQYYFNQYETEHKIKLIEASSTECEVQLKKAIEVINQKYTKEKFDIFDASYSKFILEEITWIKASGLNSIEEYQNVQRKSRINEITGDRKILRKNSKLRQAFYEILIEYNNNLNKINKIDLQDKAFFALKSATINKTKAFTHIFVDNSEILTKVELDLLKTIYNETHYSSITFIFNIGEKPVLNAWISNGKAFSSLGYDMKGKSITLTEHYDHEVNEDYTTKAENYDMIESYTTPQNTDSYLTLNPIEYIDLKRNVSHKFIKDPDALDEIYIKYNGIEEKVVDTINIPVFNEIAAGSPILMNDSIEDNYLLPKEWIRNTKDTFILKVKGDSMINKNIDDGDLVVINKQPFPNVKDIVAVDINGEATLKTYKKIHGQVVLMPENEKYDPIIIEDQEVHFLGVAIGLIKN